MEIVSRKGKEPRYRWLSLAWLLVPGGARLGWQQEATWLPLTGVQGTPLVLGSPHGQPWEESLRRGQVGHARWESREVLQQWDLSFFFLCSDKIKH